LDVIGVPQAINLGGVVENDLVATETDGVIKFSATGDVADTATGSITAAGVTTNAPGTGIGTAHPASLVFDNGVGVQKAPKLVLAKGGGTFSGDTLFTSIDPTPGTVQDLVCGLGTIRITGITDDEATPLAYTNPIGGPVTTTPGQSTVAASNTIHFGVSLTTVKGGNAAVYQSGACTGGTFNVVVDY
jgi:hypothetical protein